MLDNEKPRAVSSHTKGTINKEVVNEGSGLLQAFKQWLFGRTGPRGGQYDGFVQKTSKRFLTRLINQVINALVRGKRRK